MIAFRKPAVSTLPPELVVAMTRAVIGITVSLESDLQAKQIRATFTAPLEEMDRALIRDTKNPFTAQLADLDFQRDEVIIAIRSHCIAAIDQYMINKTKSDQAKIVLELVKKMSPNVIKLGYQEESTEIHALLAGAEQITGAIEESGSAPLFSLLDTLQKKFDTLYLTKVKANTKADEPRRTKSICKDLTDSLRALFNHIETGARFDSARFESIITALNTLTDEYSAKAAAAKTRKEHAAQ